MGLKPGQKFGRSITDLWALADKFGQKASAVLKAIVNDPGAFARNLAAGIGDGFKNFFNNLGSILPNSLFSWLSQGLSLANIVLPASFDIKGIVSFLTQLMGLTWNNIKDIDRFLGALIAKRSLPWDWWQARFSG